MGEREITNFIESFFRAAEENPSVVIEKKYGSYYVNIEGLSNPGLFIGKEGIVLRSFQYILNIYVHKEDRDFPMVMVDINGYKLRQIEMLKTLALNAALRAKRLKEPVSLKPMSASARKIVHMALHNYPNIWTHSDGREPRRYVVVDLKK